jgi:hypothetical protein
LRHAISPERTPDGRTRAATPLYQSRRDDGESDMKRLASDWNSWAQGERIALNLVIGSLLLATACLAI